MSMLNYLYSNRLNAFDAADRSAVNAAGGVGLWSLPETWHYAYNPQKIKHSRWMFLIAGSYEPTDRRTPIKITKSGSQIVIGEASTEDLYVTVLVSKQVGGVMEVDYEVAAISAGSMSKTITGSTNVSVIAVCGVSLTDIFTAAAAVKDTRGQLYFCSNSEVVYEDADYIIYQGDILYKATTPVDKVVLSLANRNGGETQTFAMDLYRGECSFDAASVVRNWFTDELAAMETYKDLSTEATAQFVVDKRLLVTYSIQLPYTLDDANTDTFGYYAVNGCKQIGELATILVGKINRLPLRKYDGYPIEKTILVKSLNALPGIYIPLHPSGSLRPPKHSLTRVECAGEIADYTCTPQAPFFVRWIGDNGAVEQWMFERKQTYKPAVKSSSVFERDIDNVAEAMTNEIAYDITTQNQVVIGAEDVEQSIYEVLKKLPFSPEIEWYREDTGKWIRLVVDKFDSSYDTDSQTHELEITLSLPTRYTQF